DDTFRRWQSEERSSHNCQGRLPLHKRAVALARSAGRLSRCRADLAHRQSRSPMSGQDLSQLSMQDLFRMEAESQTEVLTAGLLALERNPRAGDQLETCMRAAHSLKGAARIVDLDAGVALAHAMEDLLVAA